MADIATPGLVTANQFQTSPNFLGAAQQGVQLGAQFRQQRNTVQNQELLRGLATASPQEQAQILQQVAASDPQLAIQNAGLLQQQRQQQLQEVARENSVLTNLAVDALGISDTSARRNFLAAERDRIKADGRDTSKLDFALEQNDNVFDQLVENQARQGFTMQERLNRLFPDQQFEVKEFRDTPGGTVALGKGGTARVVEPPKGISTLAKTPEQSKEITSLRKEVGGIKEIKDARGSIAAHNRAVNLFKGDDEAIREFASKATGQGKKNIDKIKSNVRSVGDIALIFQFMKSIDPASTVREGEFATAQNTGGLPDRIFNQYNRILEGDTLTDEQRLGFIQQIRSQTEAAIDAANAATSTQRAAAQSQNLPFEQIFPVFELPPVEELGLLRGQQQPRRTDIPTRETQQVGRFQIEVVQ